MKDLIDLIAVIKHKSERLSEKYKAAEEQINILKSQIEESRKQLNLKSQQLEELEGKIKILKISKSVGEESTKDVKLKINEMVREIDKCIALINK
ncbi:MAG: hypothetical protein IT232_03825 [Flavobacteriales bacterium]|nr:hypothetical protein [Flavobacteriales bacterium]